MLPSVPARAQEPASQQTPAPPDATPSPAPVVRSTPKPIVLRTPATAAESKAPGSASRQTSTPTGSTAPAQAKQTPSANPNKTPSSFTSKILTTPYKPASNAPMVQLSPGPFNRQVIFLDPAHGGNDSGSRIEDSILEKDVTLQLAFQLRSLLQARGFTVVLSRDADAAVLPNAPDTPLSLDARAGIGNHARAVACLLLHAAGSGRGVHLYSSELTPAPGELLAGPWLTAQAPWVTQSIKLQKQLGEALGRSDIPLVMGRASIRPVDSLTCPALVVELAPQGGKPRSLTDDAYLRQVANAIAGVMVFWQNTAQPPPRLVPQPQQAPAPVTPSTPMPGADHAPSLPAPQTGVQP